jgi:hypothetical protein
VPFVYVYIAGPYTNGDVAQNVAAAVSAANAIARLGAFPYIPHLCHFWHLMYAQPYSYWMTLDMAWLEQCDILYRLPGYSEGADQEIQRAMQLQIPVVYASFPRLQDKIDQIKKEKDLGTEALHSEAELGHRNEERVEDDGREHNRLVPPF